MKTKYGGGREVRGGTGGTDWWSKEKKLFVKSMFVSIALMRQNRNNAGVHEENMKKKRRLCLRVDNV